MEFKYPLVTDIVARLNSKEWRSMSIDALWSAVLVEKNIKESCLYSISPSNRHHQEYINVFNGWKEKNVKQVLMTGVILDDITQNFTAQIDLIVELKDASIALIDLKIGRDRQKEWPVQLAAYKYLAEKYYDEIDKFFILNIRNELIEHEEIKEGKKLVLSFPQIEICEITYGDLTHYWSIFSSSLACYQYFETKE